ncbi:hypothetical protein C1H76_5746 [Elsinoe australis]|uniref:DUF4211 domain-containing protein n=1 Tax=Elsinoe australis TaxID=40998 RepID=A0A4U7AUM6_9PEZI|nr:hypothetical protein C1H76_5746 [Elsinoe australis]
MTRSARKRQTRLEFTPLPSSSPAAASYHRQIRDRAAAVGYEGSPNPAKRRKITGVTASQERSNDGDHSAAADHLPTPDASNRPNKSAARIVDLESDSDASLPSLPTSRPKGTKKKQVTLDLTSDGPAGNQSSPLRRVPSSPAPTPDSGAFFRKPSHRLKSKPTQSGRATRSRATLSDDDSDDDIQVMPARRASDNLVELSGNENSDDSDQLPTTPAQKRRGSRRAAVVSLESDEEDEMPRSSRLRRGKRKRSLDQQEDNIVVHLSSDSEIQTSSRQKSSHALSKEEQQELDDDVNDLKSSSSEEDLPRPTQRPTAKSERQLALEKLKRRRAGIKEDATEAEDSDEELEADESDEVEEVLPRSSAKDMFNADEYDKDFLTDEGDDTLGAPDGLPLAFTRYASMKPKELFQYVVEWMIQKKINPGFNMEDEIYDLAFKKLDDEVKGLAGSKFESSAWKPEFLFALRARPDLASGRMDRHKADAMFNDKCDACNRSGHTPTYEVQFQGRPYHVETLEDVEQREDSDSEDGSDEQTRDAKGHVILPESHSFFVGKFCMANAETAHSLQHWRYHLYEWVVAKLSEMGHLKAEKIVQRDGWGEPKRRKFANKVLDQMVEHGTVKQLYRDFRSEVEKARDAKHGGRWASSP